jgi:hypothetical protein
MADEQTLPVNGSRKDGMQAFRSDAVLGNQKPLRGFIASGLDSTTTSLFMNFLP